jgi:Asp-tRNA(Asn)/Glu-tRNA(Gln) amidotransferase A subunit family amidase
MWSVVVFLVALILGLVAFIDFESSSHNLDQGPFYERVSLNAPVLRGPVLRFIVNIAETRFFGRFLISKILADSKIPLVRRFASTRHEAPTFLPLVLPKPEQLKQADEDARHTKLDSLVDLSNFNSKKLSNFRFWTIEDYAAAYRSGYVSPEEVARRVIRHIKDSDQRTPPLRIFITWNETDILKQAQESTKRFASGRPLGVFDGVPVAIKDELHVAGYPTTVGTTFLGKSPLTIDATVVARLRSAGAIILGKTNMHEIGMGTTGENFHHGHARNPYNTSYHTGGSSSGSATAVACGLVPVAIGADGGGSIRIPSGLCGLVGLKPTFGRVSTYGGFSLAWSVGHFGPMASTAKDAALSYLLIAGEDSNDPHTHIQPSPHLARFTDTKSLKDLKIGLFEEWFNDSDSEVLTTCREALKKFEALGAQIVRIEIPHLNVIANAHVIAIGGEIATSMEKYLSQNSYLDLSTRMSLAAARLFTARDYIAAQKVRTYTMNLIDNIFEGIGVDVIVTPALASTAPLVPTVPIGDFVTLSKLMRFTSIFNLVGNPAIVFPVGYTENNLPIGLQFAADHWREDLLLRLANVADDLFPRRPPEVYFDNLRAKSIES